MEYNPQGLVKMGLKNCKEKGFMGIILVQDLIKLEKVYCKSGYPNNVLNFNKEENHVHPIKTS